VSSAADNLIGKRLELDFPFLDASGYPAKVIEHVPDASTDGDIALLELERSPPPRAEPARLLGGDQSIGNRFAVHGYPNYGDEGRWSYGILRDRIPNGWMQMEDDSQQGYRVEPGFSGAPVWDAERGGVVGMIVRSERDAAIRAAFLIPSEKLWEVADPSMRTVVDMPVQLTDGLGGLPGSPVTSVQQFLAQYLGRPDAPVPFGGREAELASLDRWLEEHDHPYALVVAGAGRGKSALLAQWANRVAVSGTSDVALIPISIRFGTTLKSTVFALIGARLRRLNRINAEPPLDPDGWLNVIEEILSEDRTPDAPLLLVIDGADEAAGWELGKDLRLPPTPGKNVKVLVTARQLAHRDANEWLQHLGWDDRARQIDLPPLDSRGISHVLRALGNPLADLGDRRDVVDELLRLSQGDPLLVRLYVEQLRRRPQQAPTLTVDDLGAMQPGIAGYLEGWWDDQTAQWEAAGLDVSDETESALELLNLCATALGPISRDEIDELVGGGLTVRRKIEEIGRLIVEGGGGAATGFVFSHPRLGDFFWEEMGVQARREWDSRFIEYCRSTLAQLQAGEPPAEAAPYAVRYFGAHLERAKEDFYELDALIVQPWMLAWEELDGSHEGFLTDVGRVWDSVDRAAAGDLSAEVRAWVVGRQIRYALIRSSILSLAAGVPPELLARLVKDGLWTPEHGLQYARRMTDLFTRGRALLTLAAVLPPQHHDEILDEIERLDEEWSRVAVLAELAPHLSESGASRALGIAARIQDPDTKAEAIFVLHETLSPSQLREASALASALPATPTRIAILHRLRCALLEGDTEALDEALAEARTLAGGMRVATLLRLRLNAAASDKKLLDEAVGTALKIEASPERADALLACLNTGQLEPQLAGKMATDILDASADVISIWDRGRQLESVFGYLPDELIAQALEQALNIEDAYSRSNVLTMLASRLSAAEVRRALTLAADWSGPYGSAPLLARLAELGEVAEALTELAKVPGHALGVAVEVLAQALPSGQLDNLLVQIKAAPEPYYRENALAKALPALAEHGRVEEALELALQLQMNIAVALAGLAPLLPDTLVDRAFTTCVAIKDPQRRCEAIKALAGRIDERRFPETLEAIGEADAHARMTAMTELVDRLPSTLLNDAAVTARAFVDDAERAQLLAAFGRLLPDDSSGPVLQAAFEATRRIAATDERLRSVEEVASVASDDIFERQLEEELRTNPDVAVAMATAALGSDRNVLLRHRIAEVLREQPPDLAISAAGWACEGAGVEEWRTVVVQAEEVAAKMSPEYLTGMWIFLAQRADESLRADLIRRAIEAAPQDPHARNRALALAAAYPLATLAERQKILEDIFAAAEMAEDPHYVIDALPDDLSARSAERAADVARQAPNARARASGLRAASRLFGSPQNESILREALVEVGRVQGSFEQSMIVLEIAPKLPLSLIGEALAILEKIESMDRDRAVSALAGRLAELGHVDDALDLLDSSGGGSSSFDWVGQYLDIRQLLRARKIADKFESYERERALSGLALRMVDLGLVDDGLAAIARQEWYTRGTQFEAVTARLVGLPTSVLQHHWTKLIHQLSSSPRAELLPSLAALAPVVQRLAGDTALVAAVEATTDVAQWFKTPRSRRWRPSASDH
jgi:hypothetical protein